MSTSIPEKLVRLKTLDNVRSVIYRNTSATKRVVVKEITVTNAGSTTQRVSLWIGGSIYGTRDSALHAAFSRMYSELNMVLNPDDTIEARSTPNNDVVNITVDGELVTL